MLHIPSRPQLQQDSSKQNFQFKFLHICVCVWILSNDPSIRPTVRMFNFGQMARLCIEMRYIELQRVAVCCSMAVAVCCNMACTAS